MPGIDMQGHAVFFSKMTEDGLFFRGCGIFTEYPHASVGVAADEMVGVEFDDGGGDHIEEFLDTDIII